MIPTQDEQMANLLRMRGWEVEPPDEPESWTVWYWPSYLNKPECPDIPVPYKAKFLSLNDALRVAKSQAESGSVDWVKVFASDNELDIRFRWPPRQCPHPNKCTTEGCHGCDEPVTRRTVAWNNFVDTEKRLLSRAPGPHFGKQPTIPPPKPSDARSHVVPPKEKTMTEKVEKIPEGEGSLLSVHEKLNELIDAYNNHVHYSRELQQPTHTPDDPGVYGRLRT